MQGKFTFALKGLLAFTVIALIIAVLIAMLALRNNPARAPLGELRQISSADTTIEYVVGGPNNGIPVILLASYARSVSDFNELSATLRSKGYRSLAMHARGVGNSALPSLRTSLFDYAEDLRSILDAEGLSSPVPLIGHAFGNRIARAFASRYPERVDSLILISAGDSAPPPKIRDAIMTVMLNLWPETQREKALHHAFFAPGNSAPQHWLSGWYPLAGLAQAHASANTPAEKWTAAGGKPIFVIQSQFDTAAPASGQALLQRLPTQVILYDLANAGHAALPEQPELIAQLILDYLSERN
ncbi:alpha/beta fold hydrolase [Zhongshania sp.]|uniref:alpha/beta fold hydrolase n=1 Tax=Zhongshania sp. TaxID=1971902 RepID=UPI003561B33F